MERSKGSTWGFLISTPPVFSRRMQERIHQTDQFRLDLPFKPRSTSGWERRAILPAKQKTTPLIAKLGICDKTKKNKIRLAILNYKLAKRLLPSSRNLSQVQWTALMSWKRCRQDCHQNQQEDRCRRAAHISISPGTAGLSQALLAPRFDAPATAKSACA